jgi:nitrite reductase/ring-hydroxylating ferredoxin subunit
MQLGVKLTAEPVEPPLDFVRVLDASALTEGLMHAAEVETMPLLVTRTGAAAHAVSGVCTHRGAPLAGGTQDGNCVRCPWHGSRFALDDGHVVEGPATFGLATFDARITEGAVSVRVVRP